MWQRKTGKVRKFGKVKIEFPSSPPSGAPFFPTLRPPEDPPSAVQERSSSGNRMFVCVFVNIVQDADIWTATQTRVVHPTGVPQQQCSGDVPDALLTLLPEPLRPGLQHPSEVHHSFSRLRPAWCRQPTAHLRNGEHAQIHIAHVQICGHLSTCFPVDPGNCAFQSTSSSTQRSSPRTCRAVMAVRVYGEATAADALRQEEGKSKTTLEEHTKQRRLNPGQQ